MNETWELSGHYVMACNCDFGCPCNFNARPTAGYCEGLMGFVVRSGRYGDVTLDGLNGAALAKWPAAIHEGNGAAAIFIDSAGTDEQVVGLGKILSGEVGGPMAIFRGTWSKIEGPQPAGLTVTLNGKESGFEIEGVGRMVFDAIKNPVSGAEAFPRVVLPQGLMTNELEQFTTKAFEFDRGELSMSHVGKTAQIAEIAWKGP